MEKVLAEELASSHGRGRMNGSSLQCTTSSRFRAGFDVLPLGARVFVFIAAFLVLGCSTVPQGDSGHSSTNLRVRSCPRLDCDILEVVTPRISLEVGACIDEWCNISTTKHSGWAARKYLVFERGLTVNGVVNRVFDSILPDVLCLAVFVILMLASLTRGPILPAQLYLTLFLVLGLVPALHITMMHVGEATFMAHPAVSLAQAVFNLCDLILVVGLIARTFQSGGNPLYTIAAVLVIGLSVASTQMSSFGGLSLNIVATAIGFGSMLTAAADSAPF